MENTIKNVGLTDLEIEALYKINEIPNLTDALYKVILSSIYSNGVIKDGVTPNGMLNWAVHLAQQDMTFEEKGRNLEAIANGLNYLEAGVKKVREFVRPSEKVKAEKVNKAV